MQEIDVRDFNSIASKLMEFMKHCQKLEVHDTYLIVNRVESLDPGIYFLDVVDFSISLKKVYDEKD